MLCFPLWEMRIKKNIYFISFLWTLIKKICEKIVLNRMLVSIDACHQTHPEWTICFNNEELYSCAEEVFSCEWVLSPFGYFFFEKNTKYVGAILSQENLSMCPGAPWGFCSGEDSNLVGLALDTPLLTHLQLSLMLFPNQHALLCGDGNSDCSYGAGKASPHMGPDALSKANIIYPPGRLTVGWIASLHFLTPESILKLWNCSFLLEVQKKN